MVLGAWPFSGRRFYNRALICCRWSKDVCMSLLVGLVFGLHLLCVNIASAGPLVAAVLDGCEGRGSRLAGEAGRYLSGWALLLLLPGGLLGVVIGALLWSPTYYAVLQRLPSKIYFGVWELVFSLALMGLHYAWWKARPQCPGWERGARIFVALLASTNLLYHFPVLFGVIESTATSATPTGEVITSAEFRGYLSDSQLLSRVTHFLLAALANCGLMLLGLALRMHRRNPQNSDYEHSDARRMAIWGGRLALVPTLLQIPTGLWLTATLPPLLQGDVTGGDVITCLLFIVSLACVFALLQVLASISIGDFERPKLIRAMIFMVAVVLMMSVVLQRLRAKNLAANSPEVVAIEQR